MKNNRGFTIVELLIVVMVIAILATITIIGFNGIRERTETSKRESDMSTLTKAIHAARINTNQELGKITNSYYSVGACIAPANNPNGTEPRDLDKTHGCWVRYYLILDRIGAAAEINLSGLRSGDSRGNPYMFDENEGENGNMCATDSAIRYFTGNGISMANGTPIPKFFGCSTPS